MKYEVGESSVYLGASKVKDKEKPKQQLINELAELRQRIAELEKSEKGRRRADEILQVSEIRYRLLFETAQDGILLLDADTGDIIDVNPFLVNMLGYSHEELLGKKLWEIGLFKDIAVSKTAFLELQGNEYVRYDDLPLETKDGRSIDVEFISNVYHVNHTKVIQCNIRDITGHRRLEDELKKYREHLEQVVEERTAELKETNELLQQDIIERKKAEETRIENERLAAADRAKSEFLANMSHELRTPLNSSIGFSELLKQGIAGELSEKQKHFVDNIFTSNQFLLTLINDILDLSKIEAGKTELAPEKMSVPVTIKETLTLIKEKTIRHKVLLKTEFDPGLEYIEADKQRFKQILFNLLSNAVKFSKEEGGTVTIKAKKDGDMAKISVSDTGIGIKGENIGRLFHKFEQLESGISQKYGGTGLGLAITKQLVELHGGKIWAESKFGEGSTFTFTLPIGAKKE